MMARRQVQFNFGSTKKNLSEIDLSCAKDDGLLLVEKRRLEIEKGPVYFFPPFVYRSVELDLIFFIVPRFFFLQSLSGCIAESYGRIYHVHCLDFRFHRYPIHPILSSGDNISVSIASCQLPVSIWLACLQQITRKTGFYFFVFQYDYCLWRSACLQFYFLFCKNVNAADEFS